MHSLVPLPPGWTERLLDEVADRGSGHTPDKEHPEYWNGGIRWVSLADGSRLDRGYIIETAKEISALGIRHSSAVVFPRDTVILLRDADVGRCGILGQDMAVSQHFIAWKCSPSGPLESHFLYYQLQNRRREFERFANGSTILTIGLPFFKRFKVRYPSRAEQSRIVDVMHSWDEYIEKMERLISAKQKRTLAVAQACYAESTPTHKAFGSGVDHQCVLGDLFEESNQANIGLSEADLVTVGKYAIRRQMDHFTRTVASKDLSSYRLLRPGDFVYDPMSAYYGAIGRYNGPSAGIVSPAYRVLHLKSGVNSDYIAGLLKSHYIRFQLQARSSQNNKEGKRRVLGRGEFNSIPIDLPSPSEQERIAKTMRTFDDDVDKSTQLLHAIRAQRHGLMQKLLTGEWRVPVRDGDVDAMPSRVAEEAAQ